jgi:hypothetical protein
MTYRTGDVSEVAFGDRARRPGDELDGYTIAKITLRLMGGSPFLLFWEAVGDEFHSRRMVSASEARWINFEQAKDEA